MKSHSDEMIIEIGIAMLEYFADARNWRCSYATKMLTNRAKTIRECCYESANRVGATYFESERAMESLTDNCHILGYGDNIGTFNFAQTTTIEMVRVLINATINQAERRLVLHGPSPPMRSDSLRVQVPALPKPPVPPLTYEVTYGDEQFTATFLPPTPEITVATRPKTY